MKKVKKEKPQLYDNALKVFVTNLPLDDELSWKSVLELCSSCGEVQFDNFFAKTVAGQRTQHGLVVFSTADEAEKAVKFTGRVLGGKHIILRRHSQFVSTESNCQTVYVSNLSKETDEEDLWNLFEDCGSIQNIHIDRLIGVNSFVGEVLLEGASCVKKALKLNDKVLKGNKISVKDTSEEQKQDQSETFNIFVMGLPAEITQDDITNFFDGCGPIKRIKIGKSGDEAKATVFFKDSESAENALGCDGNDFNGYVISVSQREKSHSEQYENALFIAGISGDTKDVDIFLKFQDCGFIKDVKVMNSKQNLVKKAVIEFKDPEAVNKALAMENIELKGETLMVSATRDIWFQSQAASKNGKEKNGKKRKMNHPGPNKKNFSSTKPKRRKHQSE